jgi:hypothetical protein
MRASGRDIVELFGYRADDTSPAAVAAWKSKLCPFTSGICTKTNHDKSIIYGTCSVSSGVSQAEGSEIIVCPKRLYAEKHTIFSHALDSAWPGQMKTLIAGGILPDLKKRALAAENPVIAFGQGSGKEIQINSNGQMSMDWVLQSYAKNGNALVPQDFIGLEIQSIDITGNYRDTWDAYRRMKEGNGVDEVPNSGHGLNWANVHKRLIPQIIRKGNIYAKIERCAGFYFIVPDAVYKKFEEVIGNVPTAGAPGKENLSVITFRLGKNVADGQHRKLELVRQVHYPLGDVAAAFIANLSETAPAQLDQNLRNILS